MFTDKLDPDILLRDIVDDVVTDHFVVLLIQLRDAANYLELKELHRIFSHVIGSSIAQDGQVRDICTAMDELYMRGTGNDPLFETLFAVVKQVPEQCFSPSFPNIFRNKGIGGCLLEHHVDSGIPPHIVARALQQWWKENKEASTSDEPSNLDHQKILQDMAHCSRSPTMKENDLTRRQQYFLNYLEALIQLCISINLLQNYINVKALVRITIASSFNRFQLTFY